MKLKAMCVLLVLLATAGAQNAWARFTPPTCKSDYSIEDEITQGREAALQVYTQVPVLEDSDPVAVYVRQLGAKLTAKAPGYKWPYNFHVVNVADINAFALPGGAIFVNMGTVQATANEAQLAGVMAHEISHVVMRHTACRIAKQRKKLVMFKIGEIAAEAVVGSVVGGVAGEVAGDAASEGVEMGEQTLFLTYSREAEKQADLLGTDILYDAGYDPKALPEFFTIIKTKYGKGGAQFLNDHPNPGNRVEYVGAEIATLPPRKENVTSTPEFTAMSAEAQERHALTANEVKAGNWRGNAGYADEPSEALAGLKVDTAAAPVASSKSNASNTPDTWKVLEDSTYALAYPADWEVSDGYTPGMVAVSTKDGMIEKGDDYSLARGLLTGTVAVEDGADIDVGMRAVMEKLNMKGGVVKVLVVGEQSVRSVDLAANSALTDNGVSVREHDWMVVFTPKNMQVRYVVFVVPEKEYKGLKPTFDKILASFVVK